MMHFLLRHGGLVPAIHVLLRAAGKTWMPATSAGMTLVKVATACRGHQLNSETQHRLGDDVFLDLVRTAVDRHLAVVEVVRRDHCVPVVEFVRAVLIAGFGRG